MNRYILVLAALAAPAASFAALYGDTPDAKHAWAVHDRNRPNPVKIAAEPGKPPSDAVVLFDGSRESFEKNWCDTKGNPSKWACDGKGEFHCKPGYVNGGAIRTRGEFGDCQLHIEFRHDADIKDHPVGAQMRGNSGLFLMSNYEIQILESYGTDPADMRVPNYADGQAAAVYAENPPMVNPARKPGEWQTYDIVFHQPVWDGLKLVHPGSVSVVFNGVLVQDHWELEGLTTHCVRRPLAPHKTALPIMLQDHGCAVYFRNVWLRPLPSRWANKTHSSLTADENEVMALRRRTAGSLFAKITDPAAPTAENVMALAEVVAYAMEGEAAEMWKKTSAGYLEAVKAKGDAVKSIAGEIVKVRNTLRILERNRVIDRKFELLAELEALSVKYAWR
ncbi:MAG: DUF1080 domain-containing protein [Kiritimatiellae bacterium]|nr:DUF1080 domain-containing protein [Kiritimatiellia bacterium]